MNGDVFFDTNVLVYATAKDDARAITAIDLLVDGGAVSIQVLNEFASVARRKLKWSWPEVTSALLAFRALLKAPLPVSLKTHEAALALAQRDGLNFYDALTVASALEARCKTLLSDDMQDGRVIAGGLTIRNPFGVRTGPS